MLRKTGGQTEKMRAEVYSKAESRFTRAIKAIDEINSKDPSVEELDSVQYPAALLYSQRMTDILHQFDPEADELLRLAARGQHIKRWSIPRESYAMHRKGYLQWRTQLKKMHADLMYDILLTHGYTHSEASHVSDLILKKAFKKNAAAQTLEDVVCLVFLRYYFDDFLVKHNSDEAKVISILQKTWGKMSAKGHGAALKLKLSRAALAFIKRSLQD